MDPDVHRTICTRRLSTPGAPAQPGLGLLFRSQPRARPSADTLRELPSSGPIGPEFRQRCFAGSDSLGHCFKKIRLPHWLALARSINLPSPRPGWTPSVLDCESPINGVKGWGLFHPRTIEMLVAQILVGHDVRLMGWRSDWARSDLPHRVEATCPFAIGLV
jgi:hypothetical protein